MGYKIKEITNQTISLELIGNFTAEDAKNHVIDMDPILDRLSANGKKAQFLVHTTDLGRISLEGRRSFAERNGDTRVGDTAVIGVNRILSMMARFIMVASGKNNIRFFDNEEEALKWLESSSV